ncbi:protein FAM118A isoform X3 [Rhincodon typus]|uniref:protein FAM118A isoform X3 n=1 Tax=Rhincodon typus TaxID=259920 RepID=UPI00203050FE|nr:protein FAM118A isoform X3 [Rhincodon typus]
MDLVNPSQNLEQKSRKFLKSLTRKEPCELLLVIGTGVSAAVAPHIPALCSWRSCIEAVINAAEDLEVLHPSDITEFRHKLTEDRDLLVLAHDLIRKMSPVVQWARGLQKYSVLHIHGLFTDPCGLVLDPSGYKDVMHDQDLMEEFQDLYRTKSFVFLGCGETLRDQIFQALFLYSVQDKVDLEHFMLVRKDSHDHFFKLQAEMLLHGIKIVSYGDQFECMPQYFHDLVAQICRRRSPDGSSADSTSPILGTSCSDCVKRKQEENGDVTQKRIRKANDTDFGGS